MNDRERYQGLLKYSEAGRRLMENEDYQLLINEFEKELAATWRALAETPTTDPHLAQLQGELKRLNEIIGRARTWVEQTSEFAKTIIRPADEVADSDDYNTG
jgi:hypothetical protein